MLLDIRLGVTEDTRTISLWQQNAPSTASRFYAPLELPFLRGDQPFLTTHHVTPLPFTLWVTSYHCTAHFTPLTTPPLTNCIITLTISGVLAIIARYLLHV